MSDGVEAPGGLSPYFWLDWYVGIGGWRPTFRSLRGWRTWLRRGDAGGPLIGHATPPVPATRIRDLLPVATAPRGQVVFVERGFAEGLRRRHGR